MGIGGFDNIVISAIDEWSVRALFRRHEKQPLCAQGTFAWVAWCDAEDLGVLVERDAIAWKEVFTNAIRNSAAFANRFLKTADQSLNRVLLRG